MNQHDEKVFYKGMIILGLLMRGTPLNSIPEITENLTNSITNKETNDE